MYSCTSHACLSSQLTKSQAFLSSASHHAVNTNQLLSISSTLPFHPPSLYQPVPTQRGVTDVASFLPPFDQVLKQFALGAEFARPALIGTNRTLMNMFNDQVMLARMNPQTQSAAAIFKSTMQALGSEVSARKFDSQGLCQGMPFVWQALVPNVAPFPVFI